MTVTTKMAKSSKKDKKKVHKKMSGNNFKNKNIGKITKVKPAKLEKKQEAIKGFSMPTKNAKRDGAEVKNKTKPFKKKVRISDDVEVNEVKVTKRKNSSSDNSDGTEPRSKKKKPSTSVVNRPGAKPNSNEKTDWNKLKEEKKALKVKRKERRLEDIYQITVRAKSIYDVIRRKKCAANDQKESLKTLYDLLKGKLVELSFTHDMARVVELMIKLANIHKENDVLNKIVEELIPSFLELSYKKYAKHVVQVMITNSTPKLRLKMIGTLSGKVVKILSHKFGRAAFEALYLNTKAEEHAKLRKELYGPTYKLASGTVASLDDLVKEVPGMEVATLDNTKQTLTQLIEKNALTARIVHATLLDYLSHRGAEDGSLIELVRPHILQLISSKEGVHIAMMCVWLSPVKGRKEIVKQLREAGIDLASGEHTYLLLLAIFDCVDDTQLVHKVIIQKLLSDDVLPMAQNIHARKVLAYLCSWRDPLFFSSVVISALQAGDSNPYSKKPKELRAEELRKLASSALLKSVAANPKEWISNSKLVLLASLILKCGSGEDLKAAQQAVAQYVINPNGDTSSETDVSVADTPAVHVALKKVLMHDKILVENNEATFSAALTEALTDHHYAVWLKKNHCCFYLLSVLKNGPEDVVNVLRKKIKKISKTVWTNSDEIPAGGKAISEVL